MADNSNGEITEQWRLDDYISAQDLPSPTIAKIDVEGAELRVLTGAKEALKGIQTLYIEVHVDGEARSLNQFGDSEKELREFLIEQGFSLTELHTRDTEIHLKASK